MNFIILLIIIIITLYLFKKDDRKRKINSKLPGPIGVPIFGNLLSMTGDVHLKIQEWYNKYGPIYYIRMGNIDTVVLTEFPIIRQAFIENSIPFSSRYQLLSRIKFNGCKNLIMENGENHTLLKKVVLSEMTPTKIKKMECHIIDECKKLVRLLDEFAENGNSFIINDYIKMFSLNIIMLFAFGVSFPYNQVEESNVIVDSVHELFIAAGQPILSDFVSIFGESKSKFYSSYEELEVHANKMVQNLINDKKKQQQQETDENQSIVEKLIKQYENDKIPWRTVIQTVIDMLAAGTDTTSNTMIFSIVSLINNKEIQEKVSNEIHKSFIKLNHGSVVGVDGANDKTTTTNIVLPFTKYKTLIPYLQLVIKETFRYQPVVTLGLPHLLTEDVVIQGHKIAAGTQIIQNIFSSHRSEKYFNNPNQFIPERFLESNSKNNPGTTSLLQFGTGVRDCVGKSLAEAEINTVLATLLHRYEFINPNPTVPLNDVGIFGISLLCPKTEIKIKKRIFHF